MLRIRPYKARDAEYIKTWISSPKEHALWCANLLKYPLSEEDLREMRDSYDAQGEGGMFTVLSPTGQPAGFFAVMRMDYNTNNAHLGFIILDPRLRGRGYGRELVHLAVRYCFCMLSASSVTLKVYDINEAAHRCYASVGFADVTHNDRSLVFEDEPWGTKDMIITKRKYKRKGEC